MKRTNLPCRFLPTLMALLAMAMSAATSAAQQAKDPITERLVAVRLRPGIDIDTFNARWGSTTERAIESRKIYAVLIPGPAGGEMAFSDQVVGDVIWAEPTYFSDGPEGSGRNFYCLILPDPSQYNNQNAWGQINLDTAHLVSTGAGIEIAIVDTGLDIAHREMTGRVLPNGFNFFDNSGDVSDVGNGLDDDGDGDIDELTGHGTHMAGIIAKVAPDTMILPIKVLDSDGNTDTFRVAQGIFYAIDQGVDVINLSIGSTYDALPVEDALDEARNAGIVVAGAGGNVNMDDPCWEFPALRNEVLGVVAVNEDDIKADFTNTNTAFALSSPGVEIWSTIPGNLYASLNGTSPATAMVSGTAALLLAAHPEWIQDERRVGQVEDYLSFSSLDIDPLNPGFEGKLGAGRLDAGAALNTSIVFDPPASYPAGRFPNALAAADLDGDFVADLALVNALANSVSVLRNSGDGTFVLVDEYAVGQSPEDITAADLNGDGRNDLAAVNSQSNTVSILINNGDGTFAAAATYNTGQGPTAVVAGDLDNDGDVDLATADEDSGSVSILLNNGLGVFTDGGRLTVGTRPRDVIVADLNADDALDLATVNRRSNNLSILINRGDGTFAPAVNRPVGLDPRYLAAADFDGDNDLDLISANNDSKDLSLLLNNGNGTFAAAIAIDIFSGQSPGPLAAADFDCDGDLDIATLTGDPPSTLLSIVLNDGPAAFVDRLDFNAGTLPQNLTAADFDDDNDIDLAVADAWTDAALILINQTCTPRRRGDLNCDGAVNAFDIEPFLLALFDPAGYEIEFGDCDLITADTNRDGAINAFDIEPFLDLLFGG